MLLAHGAVMVQLGDEADCCGFSPKGKLGPSYWGRDVIWPAHHFILLL